MIDLPQQSGRHGGGWQPAEMASTQDQGYTADMPQRYERDEAGYVPLSTITPYSNGEVVSQRTGRHGGGWLQHQASTPSPVGVEWFCLQQATSSYEPHRIASQEATPACRRRHRIQRTELRLQPARNGLDVTEVVRISRLSYPRKHSLTTFINCRLCVGGRFKSSKTHDYFQNYFTNSRVSKESPGTYK